MPSAILKIAINHIETKGNLIAMKKAFLLQSVRQMNAGAMVSGLGFLLYLGASVLRWEVAADLIALVFSVIALYVFVSVSAGRKRDKEAVSYSLLWGQGALTLLLAAFAALAVKLRLGG